MLDIEKKLETRCLSSLAKVFADEEIKDPSFKQGSALVNETYSFQVAYKRNGEMEQFHIRIESDLQEFAQVRSVGLAPSELACYHDHDHRVLRSTPGLYPDPLFPLDDDGLTFLPEQWRSVWVTVNLNEKVVPGQHNIKVVFETDTGKRLGEEEFELEVIPEALPEQQLIYTQWFHNDCLASLYNVDIFSEEHWRLIDQYVRTSVEHGTNMILTPLFTPPLDTEVGTERPTVQLVDVEKSGDTYRFHFDRLIRWIELCTNRGIQYFEFAHLFTQWGARCAPKIEATENGEIKKIFGWETDATGKEYKNFLSQFLPKLVDFIKLHNLDKHVYFHVSDEPDLTHLESSQGVVNQHQLTNVDSYQSVSNILHHYLSEYPFIDALSDYQFYEQGLVDNPIPSSDHIEPFLENEVPNLWIYYCRDQYKGVSNRFFNFPSARNRIIGLQLYKFNMFGFLHWGYNFWYSELSRKVIDPFRITDGMNGFPSGDAFVVYPGEQGPIESIRMEVFYEALQDLRALKLLEQKIGRSQVIDILERDLERPLTFSEYPCDSDWLLSKRNEINRRIAEEATR